MKQLPLWPVATRETRRLVENWLAIPAALQLEETIGGRHEFVAMEHTGPGCITRLWAPFFYYDFNDRVLSTGATYWVKLTEH